MEEWRGRTLEIEPSRVSIVSVQSCRQYNRVSETCTHLDTLNFTCVTLVNFFQIGAQTAMSKFGAKCAQIKGILDIF
jgi:hypothetical protein